MAALQRFLQAELQRRNWSIPEFAARVPGLSQSNAYLIIRDGKDNVQFNTFEAIAVALGMTPAELATAIGKGEAEQSPRHAVLHALLRQAPDEALDTIDRVVRSFIAQPIRPPRANRAKAPKANRPRPAGIDHEHDVEHGAETSHTSRITSTYHGATRPWAPSPFQLSPA